VNAVYVRAMHRIEQGTETLQPVLDADEASRWTGPLVSGSRSGAGDPMWLALLLFVVVALVVFCVGLQRHQAAWEKTPCRVVRRAPATAQYAIRASRTDDLASDVRLPVPIYSITTAAERRDVA
jgi:hypothetical protein